jgi:hypothetical protein
MQKDLREKVKSGALTREQAHDQLKAWREQHRPEKNRPERPSTNSSAGSI